MTAGLQGWIEAFAQLSLIEWVGMFAPIFILAVVAWTATTVDRRELIPLKTERVLIVGGSSGIGRSIALQYAKRGAAVAVMGRREVELKAVQAECKQAGSSKTIIIVGDFSDVGAVLLGRAQVEKAFGGLDTLLVTAGVSALQPLITGVANTPRDEKGNFASDVPTKGNVQKAKDIATKAMNANFLGPLVTAVSFIPLLERTSESPAVLLVASAASVIPAPTRSIYCSSKGASLLLYQSLAIENPKVKFNHVLPATVDGSFRSGAIDGSTVHENLKGALKPDYVAQRCIEAVDYNQGNVFLPWSFSVYHKLYWLVPGLIERGASKKYHF